MKKRLIIGGVLLVAAVIAAGGMYWAGHHAHKAAIISNTASQAPKKTAPAPVRTVSGSYLISGDVFWGRGIDYYAQRSPLKYDWPFSRLSEFHPERYDGWISDMECPITDHTVPYQTQVDKLILQCPPAYTAAASKYFTAFTLANNHTDNTSAAGFADTRTNLQKNGIQYFGHYDLSQINDLCEIVSMPAKLNGKTARLPIAMCGYHWLYSYPTDAELAQISLYAKYFPVWVFPHGGVEYVTSHTSAQQALYRKMIDLGASAVFGDHPHVVEDTEAYKGKLIVYNLGNLVYDQWFDNEVTKSLILNVQVSATVDNNLQAYLDMADSCVTFKDDCLQQAQQKGLHAPSFIYHYNVLAGDSSNDNDYTRRKHPATPEVYQWLLKRLNWSQTEAGLTKEPIPAID